VRLSRRSLLIGAAGAAAGAAIAGRTFARPAGFAAADAIAVESRPIRSLSVNDRDRRRFGALTFRSGLVLKSTYDGFGGFSGLSRSADGRSLVALADNAQWLTATVDVADDGRLAGLSDTVMAPLLAPNGRPLRRTRYYDTEGLTIAGGTAYVSIERSSALIRFEFAREGVAARGQFMPVPKEALDLRGNTGLEALGVAPPRSPLAGALVAIAEQSHPGESMPTTGFILTGSRRGSFRVARTDDFDVTDLAFLPDGQVLLLERRFSLFRGLSVRLRRMAADAIRPGGLADGPVIFESDASMEIDNMEGLTLHRDGAETVVTLISDDNFSPLQRTLLLEFALAA
jgi:hypothetical protein